MQTATKLLVMFVMAAVFVAIFYYVVDAVRALRACL